MKRKENRFHYYRFRLLIFLGLVITIIITIRLLYLAIYQREFLQNEGQTRHLRTISTKPTRGIIFDRNLSPLAISTMVNSIWVNPKVLNYDEEKITKLGKLLKLSTTDLEKKIFKENSHREFLYLTRNIEPKVGEKVKNLNIPGLYVETTFHRYYPLGDIISQVLGFTNIDDHGQEGLELLYDEWLSGKKGKQVVVKNLHGEIVAILKESKSLPGGDLVLSIDKRIQYLSFRVLKECIVKYKAKSGSVIVLDPIVGEILAMTNLPSFNPNKKNKKFSHNFRNRGLTDLFEPGSTMKTISMINGLESGKYDIESLIDTNPGVLIIDGNRIYDVDRKNNRVLKMAEVLEKSSNIGIAKITLSLPYENLINLLYRIGFGMQTGSGFPGEASGYISQIREPFTFATLSFGYGISVTSLQLAQAYGIIATGGIKCIPTFLKREKKESALFCQRMISRKTANETLLMLENVLLKRIAAKLNLADYRMAGKSGTSYIADKDGYDYDKFTSSYVGIAPISNPRLVVVVVINQPEFGFYGNIVAAPAFVKIMGESLKILNIKPDNLT